MDCCLGRVTIYPESYASPRLLSSIRDDSTYKEKVHHVWSSECNLQSKQRLLDIPTGLVNRYYTAQGYLSGAGLSEWLDAASICQRSHFEGISSNMLISAVVYILTKSLYQVLDKLAEVEPSLSRPSEENTLLR